MIVKISLINVRMRSLNVSSQTTTETVQITSAPSSKLLINDSTKVENLPHNKNVMLVNDFYEKFYSLRNLGLKASILVVAFISTMLIAFILASKLNVNLTNFFSSSWIFLLYVPVGILYSEFLTKHRKHILNKYNETYQTNFDMVSKAKDHWVRINFGTEYSASNLIKQFEEWRKYSDSYPDAYQFRWGKYIYTSDAKARIMGLTTALLALIGVVLFNLFKITDTQVIIEQLIINFFFIFVLFPFVILPVFLMFVFSRDLIKILYYFIFNFFYKDKFSANKYKKLMTFLVSRIEIN